MKLKPIASNMTEIETDKYIVLFSYQTPVACIDKLTMEAKITNKRWSRTTSGHINKWLEGCKAETKPQAFFDTLMKEVK